MFKEWKFRESSCEDKSVIKRLLFSRGIKTEQDIYEFLHPLEIKPLPSEVFCDMQKTVQRLAQAIDNQEKILVYGDFDADGVTSTSVLYKTFKFLGANVNYIIPERDRDGHGFNKEMLTPLIIKEKPKVIISVDCGISNVYEVNFMNTFHIDVIISDHHETPEELPNAYAIINPKAQNALDENLTTKEIESMTSLAGVGVAFKIAQGILKHYNKSEFLFELLPLVAIGTVADIVPLVGENRYLVTKGLELISQDKNYGITKLLESANYSTKNGITAENIAFGIAPRINASGRLETVDNAVKVLTSDNPQEIKIAIDNLNALNKVRQTLCQETFMEADEMYKKDNMKNPGIILYNPKWHVGIIGIVASKFVEKYYKPTFLVTYSENKDLFRCSARGIEGVSLYDIISENANLLDGFGGHKLAAGLNFSKEKTTFEDVKKALNTTISEKLQGKELKPFINVDLELKAEDITVDFVNELSKLEPFGASNPPPVFVLKNLKLKQKKLMGENNEHLRIIAQADNQELTCLRWAQGDVSLVKDDIFDIAFHPQINNYQGNISVQLIIDDIHSSCIKEEVAEETGLKLFDHRSKTGILSLVDDYVKRSKLNIKVFAESKVIKDSLKPYEALYNNICNRFDIESCDSLMLFDYPADRECLAKILEVSGASQLHFMKYDIKTFEDKEFLTTFIKMLRYADNNGGNVDILRCASALGKSFEVIYDLLDLLKEGKFLDILESREDCYKIKLGDVSDVLSVLKSPKFEQISCLLKDCENFQKSLLDTELDELDIV